MGGVCAKLDEATSYVGRDPKLMKSMTSSPTSSGRYELEMV
jgi:hypothetical protein